MQHRRPSWRKHAGVFSHVLHRFFSARAGIPWRRIVVTGVGLAVCAGLLGVASIAAAFAWYSQDIPDPNAILNRNVAQTTQIYDRTGEHLLYEIAPNEKRTLVRIEEIPLLVQQATLTAEDRKFYEHGGFSLRGMTRAMVRFIFSFGRVRQGGSTITQQLVKNAILTSEKKLSRKIQEFAISLALERNLTKEQILQMYLNEIGYGGVNYGVEAASQAYFHTSVRDVTLAQAATLAALPNRPSMLLTHPDALKARRDWILQGMVDEEYITQEQADVAKADTAVIVPAVGNIAAPHFVLWVKEQLEERYGTALVETGGLRVTTSLDFDQQTMAEAAVVAGVEANGETYGFQNAGLVAVDPRTGEVRAMVGSPDFHNDEIAGQVNVTLRPLQPGSSMKPIVYAAALERGYTPSTLFWDVRTTFPTATGPYTPQNYDGGEHGPVTMRQALQGSLNIPAVQALHLVGINETIAFLQRMGYTTITDASRVGLSLVLGGAEVTPLEHVRAFAILANNGTEHELVNVLRVVGADGTVLEEWKAEDDRGRRVLEPNIAATMSNILSDNAARTYIFGAQNHLTLPNRPAAGKTGTTNDYKDAWMVGYVPSLAAGVWVGNADGTRMHGAADGSRIAAPIWQRFMTEALATTPAEGFSAPTLTPTGKPVLDGQIPATTFVIDRASGKLATDRTPERFRESRSCGEYHTVLQYISRSDPRGAVPENPQADPQYTAWEAAVQDWIARHNAARAPGEPTMESCTPPHEEDDLHIPRNVPHFEIMSPTRDDVVSDRISVQYQVDSRRAFHRAEVTIDGAFLTTLRAAEGGEIELPAWVTPGEHALGITVFDDIDNAATESVRVLFAGADGDRARFRFVNVFNGQTIMRDAATFDLAIETPGAQDVASLQVIAVNRWTGATEVLATISDPETVTTVTWTLPEAGAYVLSLHAQLRTGGTQESIPVAVEIREPSPSSGIPLALPGVSVE